MDSMAISELMQGWESPEGQGQVFWPGELEFWPSELEFGLEAWPAGAEENISSPSGGPPAERGFWFQVNAELVLFGATERDAIVTIGGRKITLQPDGSFSIRFSLPDGQYGLAIEAFSADGADGRAAELNFTRVTRVSGEVGTHPQDPALKPPAPENV